MGEAVDCLSTIIQTKRKIVSIVMTTQRGSIKGLPKAKYLSSSFLARLNQETNCRVFLQLIRDEACRRLEAEMASVFLWDKGKQELWFPLPENGQYLRLDARLGIAGACVSSGEIMNVNDAVVVVSPRQVDSDHLFRFSGRKRIAQIVFIATSDADNNLVVGCADGIQHQGATVVQRLETGDYSSSAHEATSLSCF